ncbi:MAG TPA: polyprenol phosphomannose-dependent alpha 1,6 mannosyltransferase MptB [Micromonosporaceae bacterium]|nr:polyprenol phosphomannose-dependent alpha 1,6 mannosyltransferase MptB [Micromonosporaceae bacterium]
MTMTPVGVRGLTRRPDTIRWLGFAGSVLLGISAFVGGAFPTLDPTATPVTIAEGPHGALIYTLWGIGTGSLVSAWWLGRHLIGTGLLSGRWVTVTAAMWTLPMILCPPIGSRDVYAYACQGAVVAAGHSPYQEGVAVLPCQWLDSVSVIWRDTPAPYGPLFLMIAGAAAKTGSLNTAIIVFRVTAILGVVMIAAFLPLLARRVGVPVDRALWLVLACPMVVVHFVGGGHNDALTLGLLLAGLALVGTRSHRMSALVIGGVLIGLSIAVKTTMGAVLPFAALFAAGAPMLPTVGVLVRRAIAVMGAALGTLLVLSWGSGLGMFGWITALSHAGDSDTWTSPPTAVGLTINYLQRPFGGHFDAIPMCRLVALIVLPVALLTILWHSRNHNPLYGAGLALLTTIFLAPVVQPWYLVWPLAMFAATKARIRWYVITIAVVSCIIMPDGSGFTRYLQGPMSFVMTAIVIWTVIRGFSWLRGYEPNEIDFDAIRIAAPVPATAGSNAADRDELSSRFGNADIEKELGATAQRSAAAMPPDGG